MAETVTLEMLQKLMLDIQVEQKAIRAELAAMNEKMGGMATTLIGIQRDIRSLQGTVATLGVAVDQHTRRLERIEQRLGLTESQH
jgi:hypothetical protein